MITSWIADTGSSVDAIDVKCLSIKGASRMIKLNRTLHYQTAAGLTPVDRAIKLWSKALYCDVDAVILADTPAVLSVGKRCMDMGFSFHWPNKEFPYFIRPDGRTILCIVEDYVPYVIETEGVVCPNQGTSSSSCSREQSRDDDSNQPARTTADESEGAQEVPGHMEPINEHEPVQAASDREVRNPDNVTLMEIEAQSLHHLLTHAKNEAQAPQATRNSFS